QAAYNELALAEADLVQESLPPNPTFSIFRIAGDGALEAERQIVGNILALSTLPFRSEIARQRFQKAQLRAAEETLRLAAGFRRPGKLRPRPQRPLSLPRIEVDAVEHRIDLQIARIELDALAKSLSLTEATRFVTLLDVAGVDRKTRDPNGTSFRERGFDVQFQIPIFDGGEVRVRQATETYNQAFNRLTEKAVNVRSEARDAFRVYRSTYDIAGHYQR